MTGKKRRSRTVLINDFGIVYRMPRKQWRRWLEAKATGRDMGFEDLEGVRCVGVIEATSTDMDAEDAKFALER